MRVGLFDSGIGGLTILNSIVKMVNHTEFFYVADTLYTPYGEKEKSIILKRCDDITNYLLDNYKIDILVIACNTATSVAIKHLREKFKDLPIIGVEPALK
ncbi:MAG: glutamate racemase, partial [Arcobacter skirrowii]|nr:glutamate racemase [Aliarcobacter skirrowii]